MADVKVQKDGIIFRRIGGRIVPIRVMPDTINPKFSPTLNVNIVRQGGPGMNPSAASQMGLGGVPVVRPYTRGPYKTKAEKRNEQRRERYAIRKALQMQKKEDDRWGSVDLFGQKWLNTRTIGKAVLAGSAAAFAVWGGSRLIGKRVAKMSNWKKLSFQMTKLETGLVTAKRKARDASKVADEAAKGTDIFSIGKAGQAQKDAERASKLARRIEGRMLGIERKTHYTAKKAVLNWWEKNQAKALFGVGAATTGTLYGRETRERYE